MTGRPLLPDRLPRLRPAAPAGDGAQGGADRLPGRSTADLVLAGLGGWTVTRGEAPPLPPGPWTWSDGRSSFARRLPGEPERVLLRTDFIGSALVRPGDRSILLHDLLDEGLAGQWVVDQVAPRVLSHLGDLVIHAGAAMPADGAAILVVGPSGRGKSTLAAFLHQQGWPAPGDDAMVVRPGGGGATVRSVYPRLKLRQDSGSRLYPAAAAPSPGWKVSIDLPGPPPAAAPRLVAIFCLGGGEGAAGCRAEPLAASRTCLELVRNSYALDPADPGRAGLRLRQAGEVANAVPGFRLAYPRDYARLPEVREAILGALAGVLR